MCHKAHGLFYCRFLKIFFILENSWRRFGKSLSLYEAVSHVQGT
jgi:hypothetical protein